jgi:HD-like signal output (HDOD) protein
MTTATEVVSRVTTLTSLPEVYLRVRNLVEDPRASLGDLVTVISTDPGLTARLLKVANSPLYGFGGRVATLSRAVAMLGMQQVHDLVLATSVTRAFARVSPRLVNMATFWRKSVFCASVARLVAVRCNVLDVERLFVEGLLREVGHPVLYQELGELASRALERALLTGIEVDQAERELLGFDFAEVGAELLRAWDLPQSMQTVVRHHLRPGLAEASQLETAIVHLAAKLTEARQSDQPGMDNVSIDPVVWEQTRLDPTSAASFAREATALSAAAAELVLDSPGPARPGGPEVRASGLR